MKFLIVEDELTCRILLQEMLAPYGECLTAVDGREAVEIFKSSWKAKQPFDLICMDIMMPHISGQEALIKIREFEKEEGVSPSEEVKVIMTTALKDPKTVIHSFYKGGAAAYLVKPITKKRLLEELLTLGVIDEI